MVTTKWAASPYKRRSTMKVRVYNKKTFESYHYFVKDIDFGKDSFTLVLEDGYKLSFDNDTYQSYILA